MAATKSEAVWGETQIRIHGASKRSASRGGTKKDNKGSRRHGVEEVPAGQASLSGSAQVHPSCGVQALGKHAHAMGAVSECEGLVPHNRGHYLRQRDSAGGGTHFHRAMGHHVDHDAQGEEGPQAFQKNALPSF